MSTLAHCCPSTELLLVLSRTPLEVLTGPCWQKGLSQVPFLVSSVQLAFPSLTAITEPSIKAGFGGILAPPVWSMHLHSSLPKDVTGSTSWHCTKGEKRDDKYTSAPTGRTLRHFMSKMNFGHEDQVQ